MARLNVLVWAWVLLVSPVLGAATLYDPAIPYRTVSSANFDVHYPKGTFNLAVRTLRLAEELFLADEALLANHPAGRIEIVLADTSDDSNGSAQVLPRNILRLYLAAPSPDSTLSSYDEWLRSLLVHELAHLVDLDHVGGATKVLRHLFGRTVSYNGAAPALLTEGVAVFAESQRPPFGRGFHPGVASRLRMAALENNFLRLDEGHIFLMRYPFGQAPYFYGGAFHLYLAQRFGESAVAQWHHLIASNPIPWMFSSAAQSALGYSLPQLWQEFETSQVRQARDVVAHVERQGRTQARRLTHAKSEIGGVRAAATGSGIFYARRSPGDGPTLRYFDPTTGRDRRLAFDSFSERVAPSADGQGVWYMAPALTHRFDRFGDLYWFDVTRHKKIKLYDARRPKASLRAREPSVSQDGHQLVFVQGALGQTWLTTATLMLDSQGRPTGQASLKPLAGPTGDMQFGAPALSPDGSLVAVRIDFGEGYHDLALVDAQTGALVRRLTVDRAQDTGPCFSPDGRFVLWVSTAGGIGNVMAYELATKRYFRATHLVGGAGEPSLSSDGKTLIYRDVVGDGMDLFAVPFNPEQLEQVRYMPGGDGVYHRFVAGEATAALAERATRVGEFPGDAAAQTPMPLGTAEQEHLPAEMEAPLPPRQWRHEEPRLALSADRGEREGPYRLHTLLPSRNNWLLIPILGLLNNDFGGGLASFNQDALQRHFWLASQTATVHGRLPNLNLAYTYDRFWPTLAVAGGFEHIPYLVPRGWGVETDTTGQAQLILPLQNRHILGLGYTWTRRQADQALRNAIVTGRFAALQLGYSYNFARLYPFSISRERGRALGVSATYYSRALGGDYDELLLGADVRGSLTLPWLHNHVLAARGVLNYALGPDRAESYFLYGEQAASALSVQTDRLFALRGFSPGRPMGAPPAGSALWAAYVEYRAPLWHIQHGWRLVPVFLQHLHLALFGDFGNTFGRPLDAASQRLPTRSLGWAMTHPWVATGAEVRLDVTLAWQANLTLRAGVAQPTIVSGHEVFTGAAPVFYVNLGTTL